jgi:spore coat protein U-like protein
MKVSTALKFAALSAAVGVLVLGPASVANASTVQTTFTVTATVQATCTISAGNLAFGTYTGVVANSTSTITVTCTNTSPYNVGLNPGATTGATVTTRQMLNGAATLNYALFQDNGHTKNWGQTVGTDTVAGTGNGAAQTLTVYGQVAAGQYPTPGSYSDTITATVTY